MLATRLAAATAAVVVARREDGVAVEADAVGASEQLVQGSAAPREPERLSRRRQGVARPCTRERPSTRHQGVVWPTRNRLVPSYGTDRRDGPRCCHHPTAEWDGERHSAMASVRPVRNRAPGDQALIPSEEVERRDDECLRTFSAPSGRYGSKNSTANPNAFARSATCDDAKACRSETAATRAMRQRTPPWRPARRKLPLMRRRRR